MNTMGIVAAVPGLTYRQVDYWCRIGLLEGRARGSGYSREFTAAEASVAIRMARLVMAGVRPRDAARAARTGELAPGINVCDSRCMQRQSGGAHPACPDQGNAAAMHELYDELKHERYGPTLQTSPPSTTDTNEAKLRRQAALLEAMDE